MRELSRRGDIRLGYRCNARCGFCYYHDMLDNPVEKEPTSAQLRGRLAALRSEGAMEVEFTGGEPTIRPDLPELVAYAKEQGFTNISVISNGLRIANANYAKRLVDAGMNDVLFSVHGPDGGSRCPYAGPRQFCEDHASHRKREGPGGPMQEHHHPYGPELRSRRGDA
jgi:uncharacterized radical SAM superfamily Fe-S cluster-containing enzyme